MWSRSAPGVEDLTVGDRVAVEPVETCGHCLFCKAASTTTADSWPFTATTATAADWRSTRWCKRSMAHKLPAGMTGMQGALVEPMAIAWRTAERCQLQSGQTAVIHGGGPIGIGVYFTLRRRGVNVIVSDPSPARRAVLRGLGVRQVLDPRDGDVVAAIKDLTGGRGAHASVDAAGVPAAFDAAFRGTRVDGNVVVVAIHTRPLRLGAMDILMSEARVTGVALSCNAFPVVIAEMAAGAYPRKAGSRPFPSMASSTSGFERLHRQEGTKILVDVGHA